MGDANTQCLAGWGWGNDLTGVRNVIVWREWMEGQRGCQGSKYEFSCGNRGRGAVQ